MLILVVMMLTILLAAFIVDRYKIYWQSLRYRTIAALVVTYPMFHIMLLGHGWTVFALIVLLLVYSFVVSGPVMYVLNDFFPSSMRYTGVALGHSIGTGVFIGLTPLIFTWLAHHFGAASISLWFYVVLILVAIVLFTRKRHTDAKM